MRWASKLAAPALVFPYDKAELDSSGALQFHLQNEIDELLAQGMDALAQHFASDARSVDCTVFLAARHANRSNARPAGGMIFPARLFFGYLPINAWVR